MDRDLYAEIDALWAEIENLKEQLSPVDPHGTSLSGHIQKMPGMHPDPSIMNVLNALEDTANERGWSGAVTYLGTFSSGGNQSTWIQHRINTDSLLGLIENGQAERVLQSVRSLDRLRLLLALLRKPLTVNEMVESCGFSSTGQVYHHLRALIAANIVDEEGGNRGTYYVRHEKVQGLVMLLAGVHDLLDSEAELRTAARLYKARSCVLYMGDRGLEPQPQNDFFPVHLAVFPESKLMVQGQRLLIAFLCGQLDVAGSLRLKVFDNGLERGAAVASALQVLVDHKAP